MSEEMLEVSRILVAFLVFTLVLIRCVCMVMFAPFFNSESFSTQMRIYMAAGFSLLMLPAAARTAEIPRSMDMLQLGILATQEMTVGLCIAFLASIVFAAVRMIGEIAGQQIGFSMANVVDPVSNVEVPILGFILNNIVMAMFVSAKLHLVLLYIMGKSYDFVPIGSMTPEIGRSHPLLEMSVAQIGNMMLIGVRLAVPIMLIMLLNSVVEGFSAKTMPQLNMQSMGMPLRIVVGVLALIVVFPAVCAVLVPPEWEFSLRDMPAGPIGDMLLDLSQMVRAMGGAGGGP